MKKIILLLSLISLPLFAAEPTKEALAEEEPIIQTHDELTDINLLIQATQESLARQKEIRDLIANYKELETKCLASTNDPDLLFKYAQTGKKLYEALNNDGLLDYFSSDFVDGLKKLKEIADKKNVPPVR